MSCGQVDSEPAPERLIKLKVEKCLKCNNRPKILLRGQHGYCIDCFNCAVMHKARAQLGKYRKSILDKKVIVGLSGGSRSSFLRHLVHFATQLDHRRKLRVTPIYVHIDESAILPQSSETAVEELQQEVISLGQELVIVPLERIFEINSNPSVSATLGTHDAEATTSLTAREQLQQLFNSTKQLTAKEDLLRSLRNQLFRFTAAELDCQQVFTGECSTILAARVLSDISTGRGAFIHQLTSFLDDRFDIPFVRPLRELTTREVGFYNYLNNIKVTPITPLSFRTTTQESIDRLVEDFVVGLVGNYPATVSNTIRTAEKITTEQSIESLERCVFCGAHIEGKRTAHQKDKTINMITSTEDEKVGNCDDCSCGKGGCNTININELVCYGCHVNLRSTADGVDLPAFVASHAQTAVRRETMREEIKDFLLDE